MSEDLFSAEYLERLAPMIEGMLFAAEESLDAGRLAVVIEAVWGEPPDVRAIEAVIDLLNERFESIDSVLRIQRWANGFRIATDERIAPVLKELFSERGARKLSRSLMETLAVVAYQQPVTKPQIDFIRGVNSDYSIRRLLESDFIEVVGRSDSVGQPLLYGTTDQFLDRFGLQNMESLPKLREVDDILGDPAYDRENAELSLLQQMQTTSVNPKSDLRVQENEQAEDSQT